MSSTFSFSTITRARNLIATVFVVSLLTNCSYAKQHLTTHFYSKTCPKLFSTVHQIVQSVVHKENRMGASLLRLHFHDCFVQGCDGSILLDDTASFKGEKGAHVNKNSVRGFEIIDEIKSAVEKVCPGVVSCADIVAIAARDSVVQLGCKMWNVKLGRRDSRTANLYAANNGAIPSHSSNLSALISAFSKVGLSSKDLVALSGTPAHRLLLLPRRPVESKVHPEPKYSGPSLQEAQNTHGGAFGPLGRGLQNSQDSLFGHTKLVGENDAKQEPSALSSPRHQESLQLIQAFGHMEPSATRGAFGQTCSIIEDSLWRQPTTAFNATSHPPTAFNAVNMPLPVPPD
ncbi:unnamed protein product [Cuscuta epithymum]|uniref:Peroxidase n=1 Tax=Cuscuta epithymum TaxID=186058 RepID=A0AAV0FT68_9ASTE|nr:unnamed protein product [Cuscuta epithymum]